MYLTINKTFLKDVSIKYQSQHWPKKTPNIFFVCDVCICLFALYQTQILLFCCLICDPPRENQPKGDDTRTLLLTRRVNRAIWHGYAHINERNNGRHGTFCFDCLDTA